MDRMYVEVQQTDNDSEGRLGCNLYYFLLDGQSPGPSRQATAAEYYC
jgi:hypothetical protein